MQPLQFPGYSFRLKSSENKTFIYAILRKKFVQLTPEEWVRQHVIQYLLEEKNYPQSLLNAEKQIKLGNLAKRYDVVCFKPNGAIQLIVECKAPSVKITQTTFDQIARYNRALRSEYLMVTNGLEHYYCQMDYEKEAYLFLKSLPNYG